MIISVDAEKAFDKMQQPIYDKNSPESGPKRVHAAAAAKLLQSCLTLCDPRVSTHQAPLSLGFSRQKHWSGLPFPSPKQESESEVAQSRPTLSDAMDCSLPDASVHRIFQARVLEWVAIAFSKIGHELLTIEAG